MATEDDWKKVAKAVDQFYQRQDAGRSNNNSEEYERTRR